MICPKHCVLTVFAANGEDGFDRAVGPGADLEGALGRRLEALRAASPVSRSMTTGTPSPA